MDFPIIDLHCDLTSYLETVPGSTIHDHDKIGCSVPHLIEGGVALQVMAIFSLTEMDSTVSGQRQFDVYSEWMKGKEASLKPLQSLPSEGLPRPQDSVCTLYAIENASCFAEEVEDLGTAMVRLKALTLRLGKPLYITITHHAENRFGGGNLTNVGLKEDGKRLLEFMSERGIAVDFSHTSDRFAEEILSFLEKENLSIPVLASHSNFRPVWNHARNLPQWLSDAIHARGGIIGLNLVRDFVNPDRHEAWLEHLKFGVDRGYRLAWGADYFSPAIMPPQYAFREPYFHPEHQNAACYQALMSGIQGMDKEALTNFGWRNAWNWINFTR